MNRREFWKGLVAMPAMAAQQYERRTHGLPPLTIRNAKAITTSAGGRYRWVFLKIVTSEPGLYGLGSAICAPEYATVITAIEKDLIPFLIGKDPDRIEDLWQGGNVRSYRRNSSVHNVLLGAVDEALWDIKGKRAGMPVYELLGGKAHDAVACYAHADGRDKEAAAEAARKYIEDGFRHVRVQVGGYGGGGFIAAGKGSRPEGAPARPAFDEDVYVDTIPRVFEYLRSKLGTEVKLLHDVHEHLSPTKAVDFAIWMEPYSMYFIEDILPPEQIAWFRHIRQVTTTPMAMGEFFLHPLEYVPLIAERLIDFIRCRVTQIGGITQAKRIAALCEAFGVKTAFQEGGENDPINQLASYHVDISSSGFGIQEENHFPPLVHELLPGTALLKKGYLYGNGAPGLGIDIDEAMAAKVYSRTLVILVIVNDIQQATCDRMGGKQARHSPVFRRLAWEGPGAGKNGETPVIFPVEIKIEPLYLNYRAMRIIDRIFTLRLVVLQFALILFCFSPIAYSQEISGGITGTITDPTGAVISGATVTVKDLARGTVRTSATNSEGIYAFPTIPPSRYEVKVEATGFRTAQRRDVALELNARMRLDIAMEVGAVTETMEVTGSVVLLQTETTQVGSVMSSTTNVNLPLNGRNFVQLTLLTAGSLTVNPALFSNGQRTAGGGRPYVNGNREESNNFLLDGVDNNNGNNNTVSYQPNVDAIQEFKIITNNAAAEFGNFQGGIVNVFIKSGTNSYHGSLFEFLRNDKLNANAWANNWQGNARPPIRHNVFGGTFGGPIIHDKLFFFADYQGIRRANPGAPAAYTVIPMAFRSGDFSRLLTERGTQLYDPLTTVSSGLRNPFPNNQIPLARFDPVALNLFKLPTIYLVPINNALQYNSLNTTGNYVTTNQGDFKLDAKLSNRDDFSARYSNSDEQNPGKNSVPAAENTFFHSPYWAGAGSWLRTISPTLLNELRAGFTRSVFNDGGDCTAVGNLSQQLGILNGNDRGPGLIGINFTAGLANSIGNQNCGGFRYVVSNNFQYTDNFTIIRGRHMMKTGGLFLRQQSNIYYAGNTGHSGYMSYTGQYTIGPNANTAVSHGLAEADFVLGDPTSVARGIPNGMWGQRKYTLGVFFQDDWRATSSLTLNLGVRWEYNSPFVEVADRQSNFQFYTGTLLLAGQNGVPRQLYNSYFHTFEPRVGFAWTPPSLGGKTVIRGAYTISSNLEGMGVGERLGLNPPFDTEYLDNYAGQILPQSTSSQGLSVLQAKNQYQGAALKMWNPNFRPSEVQQWSFFLERQLPLDSLLSIGYVGQHGTHLCGLEWYSQGRLMPNGTVQPSLYFAGNPNLALAANIHGTVSDFNQKYDGLQATLRKRFGRGLEYQATYTWSKGMSDSPGMIGSEGGQANSRGNTPQNIYNRQAEWGPSYFDAAHLFTFNAAYELPFGRGKALGSSWNPVINKIAGNWRLSGVLTFRTGFPLTILALDRSGTVSGSPRANLLANPAGKRQAGPGGTWFNTSAFSQPVAGTFGSEGVGVVRGPGMRNLDLSLQKVIPVSESKSFEFRVEAFNLTNTPLFNYPDINVTSVTFGHVLSAQGERNIQLALKFYF